MTDITDTRSRSLFVADGSVGRRRRAEARFRAYGIIALSLGIFFLVVLFGTIFAKGYTAFRQATVEMQIYLDPAIIDPQGQRNTEAVRTGSPFRFDELITTSLFKLLEIDEDADEMGAARAQQLLSQSARAQLVDAIAADPSMIGKTISFEFLANSGVDSLLKGNDTPETLIQRGSLAEQQLEMIERLQELDVLSLGFNTSLFTNGAASALRPEAAGISAAVVGSLYMMLVVLVLALPIGVAASIYLEEFAPKNRFTDIIEVNINNLAAVPSIVFGILGLAVFINFIGFERGAAVVGGLVLTLMTLPTIIIATRAALKAVPPSIRQAALGIGASKMQMVFHHVLPLAAPGILTGTIIGIAQALGETAPLLMIGMVAFVADTPVDPFNDPATALPVQIYMWATEANPAFTERTSAAIICLLLVLAVLNIIAVILRRRFERRW